MDEFERWKCCLSFNDDMEDQKDDRQPRRKCFGNKNVNFSYSFSFNDYNRWKNAPQNSIISIGLVGYEWTFFFSIHKRGQLHVRRKQKSKINSGSFWCMKNDPKWECLQNKMYNKNLMTRKSWPTSDIYMIARYFQLY